MLSIREAMRDDAPAPLGGEGKVVEADETYHGKVDVFGNSPVVRRLLWTNHGLYSEAIRRVASSSCPAEVTAPGPTE